MEELLAAESPESALRPPRVGETVEGIVASLSGDEATIDLGERPAGVIPFREAGAEQLRVGEPVSAMVVQPEGPDGRVVLSLRHTRHLRQWTRLQDLARSGELIDAKVVDANRGGVIVNVGLRGFVPLSQLGAIGAITADHAGVPAPVRALVGRSLRLRVLEADPRRERLVLSEKAATQLVRRVRKAQGAAQLHAGDVLDGTVVSITAYGVFVDVGVADGLVHRSEITWDKSAEPTALITVGQRVRAVVIAVDRERQRISLSLKRLADNPWSRFLRDVPVGTTLPATVTRLMPYGAFARVAEGVEGLIHVSELPGGGVTPPAAVARVGDTLSVTVVGIDADRRRLSLSARRSGTT